MKKIDNWIVALFLLFPFLDFITGILSWEQMNNSIGLFVKGVFLLFTIGYLMKKVPNKKSFLWIGFYFITYFLYILVNRLPIIVEIMNMVKIFYLPILILFFSYYENPKITKRTIITIFLFYLLLYLIPICFGLGHNLNEIYANKNLYFSYFYVGNELMNIFIVLLPVTILYLIESNSYILKAIFIILLVFSSLLLGTKAYYLSCGIIFIYFFVRYRKNIMRFIRNNPLKVGTCIIAILLFLLLYIPKMDLYQNIKTTLDHYEVNKVSDIFTWENVDHIIFSSRLSFLKNVNDSYNNGENLEKLLGIGRGKIDHIKDVEIDAFDIFYSIGIIGTLCYIFFFIYALKQTKLKSIYKFSFLLIVFISCLSGHVLLSPMVTTYMALLVLVSKNDQGKEKKDILFVTNMYPDKKYPHYGSFVKNTYELLMDEGLKIDLVFMHKTTGKIRKFISYVRMCGISLIKAIFENYDFIYVHFISHTTAGVFLPTIFSKNTKLVLNVHGNDLVSDTKVDKNYLLLSKLFLKQADVVISPSTYFEQVLMTEYHIPKNKIVIYPSGGVDLTKFKKISKKQALKNAKLKEENKYFGFVARIEKDKGYDTLLKAISYLKKEKQFEKIKFLIIGSGAEEPILERMIKEYKLNKFIIRKSFLSQEELVNVYNALEALIYPTRRKSESLGLTGLEAMACETLVIGSNKYGPSSYLNEENSITFNPEDAKELAEKIVQALKMKASDKKQLIKNAKEKSAEYSMENTKDIIIQVFKK